MKQWFLQRNTDGQQFWDDYLHPDCQMLMAQTYADGLPCNVTLRCQ